MIAEIPPEKNRLVQREYDHYRGICYENHESYNCTAGFLFAFFTSFFTSASAIVHDDAGIELALLFEDAYRQGIPTVTYTKGYYNVDWRVIALMRAVIPRHMTYQVTNRGHSVTYQLIMTSPIESRYDEARQLVRSVVAQYITDDMTTYDKIKVLHDWLVYHVSYPSGFVFGDIGTGASALLNKSAICDGYANAFKMLCDEAGIPCLYVMGWVSGALHAWNIVYDGSQWLNVDVTWDDPHGMDSIRYDYFLKTTPEIAYSHTYGYIDEKDYLLLAKLYYGELPVVRKYETNYGSDPETAAPPVIGSNLTFDALCDTYNTYYEPYYSSYYNDFYNEYMSDFYNDYYYDYYMTHGVSAAGYVVEYVTIGTEPYNKMLAGESVYDYLDRYYREYFEYAYNEYYYNYYNNYYNEFYKYYWAELLNPDTKSYTFDEFYSSGIDDIGEKYFDTWTQDIDSSSSGDVQNLSPDAAPDAPSSQTAMPTASAVKVNGQNVAFDAYNIQGNNYFKLRDIAYVLSGTSKQFAVVWDAALNRIILLSGSGYTPVGGELAAVSGGAQTAAPTQSALLLDGRQLNFTAYNIGGNNYFKLRDIASVLDFGVVWDGAANMITIDTSTAYAPD